MDVRLDLEDLPQPSVIRAVSDGAVGHYLQVNTAFLGLCDMADAPQDPASFLGEAWNELDEMERWVGAEAEAARRHVEVRGRAVQLQSSPVVREGAVVAIVTTIDADSARRVPPWDSSESRLLIDLDEVDDRVASQNRSRSLWLEHLVDVAGAPSVASAAERAFTVIAADLGIDRAALLRFDGHAVDVVAIAHGGPRTRRLHVDAAEYSTLRLPGVVPFADRAMAEGLLSSIEIESGAAVSVLVGDNAWGTLIIGSGAAQSPDLSTFATSMLESLASTLGMIIERDESRQRLQESNRRLEAYAHAAAHDLRSPLRRIRSFSQLLQARLAADQVDREELHDFAERIATGAERLDALLESMLEHATISTLAAESSEYSDLQAIADDICDGIVELSHDPKPAFVVQGLPEVRLPRDAAERVLRNLIDNALKYSTEGRVPEVHLTAERFEQGVRVRVRDNGIGIEPQFADKVFQLFNQLSNEQSGSGVGLAVVERLLLTRGAKIWVESEVGKGATFVIEFPLSVLRPPELVR